MRLLQMRRLSVFLLSVLVLPVNAACNTTTGYSEHELEHAGRTRSYDIYVPASAPAKNRTAVLGLHGGFGTGALFAKQAKLKRAADKHGYVLILPDGYMRSWNAGTCCGGAKKKQVDDVGFIKTLVKKVSKDYCINPKKVAATGFSNGAMLTHRLRCEAPGLLAAIAPVSGGPMIKRAQCSAAKATPALLMQGRDDPRIFWDGGVFDGSYRPSMKEVVELISSPNGCSANSQKALTGARGCETRQCGKAALRWCGVAKVGHQWPGGKTYMESRLGPNRKDVNATNTIFEFFAEQLSAR